MVDRIIQLIKQKGLSINAVEKQLGFGNGAIKRFATSSPSVDKIIALSNFLNVSVGYIITGEEKSPSLPEDKVRLLEMYDMLTDMEKGEILGELKQMTKRINIHTAEIAARSKNNDPPKVVTGDFSDILNAPDSTDDYK